MTDEDMLRAVGEVLKERLSKLQPGAQRLEFPAPVVRNEVQVPAVTVRNEVQTPEVNVINNVPQLGADVHVDVERMAVVLAEATRRFGEHLAAAAATVQEAVLAALDERREELLQLVREARDERASQAEMLSQLLQVLASAPAPVTRVKLPAMQVHVDGAHVTVPPAGPRPKRKLTIKHSDGTTSTVTES
jgi:hypothetical protein